MMRFLILALFVLLVVGGGSLIGVNNVPGEWYQSLEKPPFNPPNWVFGPAWTILYLLVAVAGFRIWTQHRTRGAMTAWWVQLGLNFLWSPVFFTFNAISWAFLVILALLVAIIAFIRITWERDRTSAVLFLPYLAWVGFAALLNGSIGLLN